MTKRVVAEAVDVNQSIRDVMTTHLHTVSADELVLSAVSIMMEHNIQNLPVLDREGQVCGLITPQQLIRKHSVQAVFLIEQISRSASPQSLAELTTERQAAFEAMADAQLPPAVIGEVLSRIYDAYTRRLIELAEQNIGPVPCRYVWLAAGSHARGEVHFVSDQDNALVLQNGAGDSERAYFSHLAMYVCKRLAECGYPLCSGRFMAATPKWCQPLAVWQRYYQKWAGNPEYDRLLNLTVFLDIRPVYGDTLLYEQLNATRTAAVRNNPRLMAAMVRNALANRPPLGIFNNLVVDKDGHNNKCLNIKRAALSPLVDLARIYALEQGGNMLATEARFDFARASGAINLRSYEDLMGAYQFVSALRYLHHRQRLKEGKAVSNYLMPDQFGSFQRQHLKDAFRIVAGTQDAVRMKFGA